MAKGNVENQVLVIRENEILGRFSYSDEEGKKMPAKAADAFLRSILSDESHEYHADLLAGKIEKVSGHPVRVSPKTAMTL